MIAEQLASDRDDMVVKALSWALRELIHWHPTAVADFLERHDQSLASRVKREVRNKLATGLKNPQCSRNTVATYRPQNVGRIEWPIHSHQQRPVE